MLTTACSAQNFTKERSAPCGSLLFYKKTPFLSVFLKKDIDFYKYMCYNPSLTLPKKERTENKLKKSRFYADFFELFLLTNTENYDIIYLI